MLVCFERKSSFVSLCVVASLWLVSSSGCVPDQENNELRSSGDTGIRASGDANTRADGSMVSRDGGTIPDGAVTLDLESNCNPFATSEQCLLPYPSFVFQSRDESTATGVTTDVTVEALPEPKESAPQFKTKFINASDGASPSAPILMHFGFDVSLENLPGPDEIASSVESDAPIALFDMTDGERVPYFAEMDRNRKDDYEGRYAFIIRPVEPLEMGHRHAVAITQDLKPADDSKMLESPPAFRALREGTPVTNPRVREMRGRYDDIFSFLGNNGYERDNLFLAWDFQVASRDFVLGPLLSMREKAIEFANNDEFDFEISKVKEAPDDNVAKIVEGTFEVPTFLTDDNTFAFDDEREPKRQSNNKSYPFTMVIPKAAEQGQPLPLTVFGHGLFGSGRGYLTGDGNTPDAVHKLAQQNESIVVATDWIGLSKQDQSIIVGELLNDINRIRLIGARLAQSIVNNIVLTKLAAGPLQQDDRVTVGDHALVDPDEIYYYGVSLGGIQGSSFVSVSPDVERAVLSVPGSMWASMLSRSVNWKQIKPVLDQQYPDPLLQQIGIMFIQTYFDHVDPANVSKLMLPEGPLDPLEDVPDNRTVLLQEAIGDSQVPNLTTRALARAMGVDLLTPAVDTPYGISTTQGPSSESALVQYSMPSKLEGKRPPKTNVPPEENNGVHSGILFLDHLQKQLRHFVDTGEIKQYCEGPCNPD
jgi:hypothetical protein